VRLGRQARVAVGAVGADPLVDRDGVDAEEVGDVGLGAALHHLADGEATAGLLGRC